MREYENPQVKDTLRTADLGRGCRESCGGDVQHRVRFHARERHFVATPVAECSTSPRSSSGGFQAIRSTKQPIASVVVKDDDQEAIPSQEAQLIADGGLQLVDGECDFGCVEQSTVFGACVQGFRHAGGRLCEVVLKPRPRYRGRRESSYQAAAVRVHGASSVQGLDINSFDTADSVTASEGVARS